METQIKLQNFWNVAETFPIIKYGWNEPTAGGSNEEKKKKKKNYEASLIHYAVV